MTHSAKALRRHLRRDLIGGIALAFVLTLFVDVAILVVPIYDMQLYDRVLQSRNMDTLTMLSVACLTGLLIYGALDYLRSACFVALGDVLGHRLHVPVLAESVRRSVGGSPTAGAMAMRDLNQLRGFMASGAIATPLDALCAPLLIGVAYMLHPAYGYLGLGTAAVLVMLGVTGDLLARSGVMEAEAKRTRAATDLATAMRDPELTEGIGMLPAIARRWANHHGLALYELEQAHGLAKLIEVMARLTRFALMAGVMSLGAVLIIAGVVTPGSLMGANLLLNKALLPFDHLVASWRSWVAAHAAWQRLDTMLADIGEPERIQHEDGSGLELFGVGFRAGQRDLLQDIDLHVPAGSMLCVTGPNGAGKSTLLRVIAGLLPEATGRITLDGAPIGMVGTARGYMPQTVALLDGTVGENIVRFSSAETAGAVAAARTAGVHDAVGRLPRGYDTMVKGVGGPLSGGMRQRIGLARALHDSPRLVVLDEPDASLDAEGTAALLAALKQARQAGAVVVVTSHRPALSAAADLRLELRGGRVTGFGPVERPVQPQMAPRLAQATA
jgi:ATP-binding cassette subfamily C protein